MLQILPIHFNENSYKLLYLYNLRSNFTFVFVIEYQALINDQNLSLDSQYNAFNWVAAWIVI